MIVGKNVVVLVKKPGEVPEHRVLNLEDPDAISVIVGGYSETITIVPERLALIFNSEGDLLELPKNVFLEGKEIRGNVIFIGLGKNGFTDISPGHYRLLIENVERYAI